MRLVCMALALLMSCTGMYSTEPALRYEALAQDYDLTDKETRAVEVARTAVLQQTGLSEYQFELRYRPAQLSVSQPGVYQVLFFEMDPPSDTCPVWLVEVSAETAEILRLKLTDGIG